MGRVTFFAYAYGKVVTADLQSHIDMRFDCMKP